MTTYFRDVGGGLRVFWCPGCNDRHVIDARWTVTESNGVYTVSPSIVNTTGHYSTGHIPECWCKMPGAPFQCVRCHVFIRNNTIEYLGDCSHAMAGKTVPMEHYSGR